jgi:hypothetical protein
MGKMKTQFAPQLARMIFERKLSDAEIVQEFSNHSNPPDELWLRQQIRTVRSNPQIYKPMTGVS